MAESMRLQLSPLRVVEPAKPGERNLLPLPVVIRCLEERIAEVKRGVSAVGSLAELTEQLLVYARQWQRLNELH